MVFKLATAAEERRRTLNGSDLLTLVVHGARFVDDVLEKAASEGRNGGALGVAAGHNY
jgi:hypothetical protein